MKQEPNSRGCLAGQPPQLAPSAFQHGHGPALQAGHSRGARSGGGRGGARGNHAGPHAVQRLPGAQAGPRCAAGAAALRAAVRSAERAVRRRRPRHRRRWRPRRRHGVRRAGRQPHAAAVGLRGQPGPPGGWCMVQACPASLQHTRQLLLGLQVMLAKPHHAVPTVSPLAAWVQERHAICLAIRREVGRRYRKLVAAGRKPEGSAKLWQQVSCLARKNQGPPHHACSMPTSSRHSLHPISVKEPLRYFFHPPFAHAFPTCRRLPK